MRDIVGPAHLGCPAYIVKLRIRYHSPLTAASWPHQDRRGCGAQPLPGPAAPPCPRRAGPAGRPAHRWGKSLLPCGRQRRRARLNRAGAPLNHVRRWAHFPAWDRRPPNFEQPRMNDLPTARPSEHPDWRAPTRSFTRFQAGAEKSRNAAQSRSGAALAITGGQGAEHRSSSRFCRRSVGHALRSASGADAQAHRHREHPRPSARH